MSLLTFIAQNPLNLTKYSSSQLKNLVRNARIVMNGPILYEDDVTFLRLQKRVCLKDIRLNRQALANLELLMKQAAGTVVCYLNTFPADNVFVTTYFSLTRQIDKDSQQFQEDENELNAWLLREKLEKALPAFIKAWKSEKQRRYGSGFGSEVELGLDALDALEASEPDDFELVVDTDEPDDFELVVDTDEPNDWLVV